MSDFAHGSGRYTKEIFARFPVDSVYTESSIQGLSKPHHSLLWTWMINAHTRASKVVDPPPHPSSTSIHRAGLWYIHTSPLFIIMWPRHCFILGHYTSCDRPRRVTSLEWRHVTTGCFNRPLFLFKSLWVCSQNKYFIAWKSVMNHRLNAKYTT